MNEIVCKRHPTQLTFRHWSSFTSLRRQTRTLALPVWQGSSSDGLYYQRIYLVPGTRQECTLGPTCASGTVGKGVILRANCQLAVPAEGTEKELNCVMAISIQDLFCQTGLGITWLLGSGRFF